MAKLRSRMLSPPRGFFYIQNGIKLDAGSFERTAELIRKHRISNKMPVGDPEADLEAFTCARAPRLCDRTAQEHSYFRPSVPEEMSTFVRTYLAWKADGSPLEDQVVANNKADTCLNCKFNQQVEESQIKRGCCGRSAVSMILRKFAEGVAKVALAPEFKNLVTPADAGLYSCQLCGCDNRSSAWIPLKYFAYSEEMRRKFAEATEGKCWKSKKL